MYFKMFIISAVQGITEFLPVSSSGHMVMLENFLHYNPKGATLEIILHLATLLAVAVFFNKKLLLLFTRGERTTHNPILLIVIGTIPAGIIGILFSNSIEKIFDRSHYLPLTFFVNGLVLLSFYFADNRVKRERQNSPLRSFIIGLGQSLAIFPGISRSGTTIVVSRWLSLSREEAFDFSFYLLFPAVLGALLLKLRDITGIIFIPLYAFGFVVAFIFGLLSLFLLKKIVVEGKLYLFGIYAILLAVLLFTT